jgi:hypothetical protein
MPDGAAIVEYRVIGDQAVVDAGQGHAPARAGDDDVVRHRHIRPILVEGVDTLHTERERDRRVFLPDDPVAVDQDVREGVVGAGRRVRADDALHGVRMVAVIHAEIVVDGVVRQRDVVARVVEAVVAEVVDLVLRRQGVVAGQRASGQHVMNVGVRQRDARRIGKAK